MSDSKEIVVVNSNEIVREAELRLARKQPVVNRRQKLVETLVASPRSYTQWGTKYLADNSERLLEHVPADFFDLGINTPDSLQVVEHIISKYVHPYVAANLKLSAGFNWTIKDGDSSTLCKFLHITAAKWLKEMGQFMLIEVTDNSGRAKPPTFPPDISTGVDSLTTDLILSYLTGYGLKFDEKDPTLDVVLRTIYIAVARLRETAKNIPAKPDRKCKGLRFPDDKRLAAMFQQAGFQIFESLKERPITRRAVNMNSPHDVAALINELISIISGIPETPTVIEPQLLPNLSKTPNVRAGLLVLLQRRALRNVLSGVADDKFLSIVEQHAFRGEIGQFMNEYTNASRIFGRTKGKIKTDLDKKVVPEKLSSLLVLLEKALGLYEASKIYAQSENTGQQKGSLVCAEIAIIISERVQIALVDLEAALAIGGPISSDLEALGRDLAALLDGEAVSNLLRQLHLVSEETALARDSRIEAEGIIKHAK